MRDTYLSEPVGLDDILLTLTDLEVQINGVIQ